MGTVNISIAQSLVRQCWSSCGIWTRYTSRNKSIVKHFRSYWNWDWVPIEVFTVHWTLFLRENKWKWCHVNDQRFWKHLKWSPFHFNTCSDALVHLLHLLLSPIWTLSSSRPKYDMSPKGVFSEGPTFFMKETASLTFFGGLPFIFRILSFFFSPIKRLIGTWELSGPMFQAKEAHVELKHKRSPRGAKRNIARIANAVTITLYSRVTM